MAARRNWRENKAQSHCRRVTLERAGITHADEEVRWSVSQIERLRPFPEVVEALSRLQAHGFRLVVLSNGDPEMLDRGVASACEAHLFERVISVAEAGSFNACRNVPQGC
jgi:2-haloacid dehalogenase